MSEIKDGGPAFPLADSGFDTIGTNHDHVNGLTVRDYFAAKAIQSHLITYPNTATGKIVAWSYEVADAMLRARSQS
ncbi:hypothetical protein PQQ84_22535 [Paraburkholderia strydomiana]|uniref:hypothetical protein n=1 Tax=Paraburkholderia strydomiana TaxID=1245417 RepID=UPI0038BD0D12